MSGAILESALEKYCCAWARKAHAIDNLKLGNRIGIPDRIFMLNGKTIFIEFKRLDEVARPIQLHVQNQLRKNGFSVYVVDNKEQFKKIIEDWIKHANP